MGRWNLGRLARLSRYRERRADRRARRAARRGQGGDPAEIRRDIVSKEGGFFSNPKR
jgi:hypothetical protein